MIASRQNDKVEVVVGTTRARQGDVKDLHLREGRVTPIDSHRNRLAKDQFCASYTTHCKGSRAVIEWTKDVDDGPVAKDVQALVKDIMHVVADSDVSRPSETTYVPHPSETEALTTTKVTPRAATETFVIKVPDTNDMDVTPLVEIKVNALVET